MPDNATGGKPGRGFDPKNRRTVYRGDQVSNYITGRNPVLEALKSGRPISKIYLQNPVSDNVLRHIESMAIGRGVPVLRVDKTWFDRIARGAHGGVAAAASIKEYCDILDILDFASEQAEKPLIVVANGIMDPHNLGAVIRNAEAAGAHGVIVPKRNAASLTDTVARTSAGAVEYMRVARAANIPAALRDLKKHGVWIFGADAAGGRLYTECDLTCAAAIVIGGESEGIGRLVGETCDFIIKLPMRGKITSLNASAAAAVLLYEAVRQRGTAVSGVKF